MTPRALFENIWQQGGAAPGASAPFAAAFLDQPLVAC
jgi:hypothetical protein